MRFRYVLPAIEIASSVAFLFIPLYRYLPSYRPRGPDGTEIVCHDNCPPLPSLYGIDPVKFARGVNLPAVVVVLSILSAKWDHGQDGHDYFHDPVWQGVGFALSGIVVWFFVGRFFDDLIVWSGTRVRPRIRILDLIFVLTTSVVATVTAIAILGPHRVAQLSGLLWLALWNIFWILIGYSGLTLRVFQLIQTKRENAQDS
jgi:hypothetical protein